MDRAIYEMADGSFTTLVVGADGLHEYVLEYVYELGAWHIHRYNVWTGETVKYEDSDTDAMRELSKALWMGGNSDVSEYHERTKAYDYVMNDAELLEAVKNAQ